MNPLELIKTTIMVPPQTVNNTTFADNAAVDTKGGSKLRVEMIVGATDVAIGSTLATTPPKIEECDTINGSYSDVEDAELSAVIGALDDDKIFAIEVDLAKTHKRYMRVQAPTAGDATGAFLCVLGRLYGPQIATGLPADLGLEELVQV
ncbi:MAG: hypothetical protein IH624_04965 [Phycisphaerae bacterium]|nr:hypothetical protein [Phycisphaerae bacterium]